MTCTGGTPTPAGQPVPQFNFTLFLSTNVTSKLTAASDFSEALLLVDDPNIPNGPGAVLNCGSAGAPDGGPLGPGICSTISTGNASSSYDGTASGYGTAVCDGAAGRPAANSYGCGRPNAFQGRIGTPQSPGQLNAVTFFSVPVDPPGVGVTRIFRITNLRANAVPVSVSQTVVNNSITGTISITGPSVISISNPQQELAIVQSGMMAPASCQPSLPSRVRVCEGFNNAWRARNISSFTGDHNGASGNGTFGNGFYAYNGGTSNPLDLAQNVPGASYNSESLFQWQNNSTNAPPNPNPPAGVGGFTLPYPGNYPLNSTGYGGLNTGISADGVANFGTRIAVHFDNIPPGAMVQVPPILYLLRQGDSSYTGDPTHIQSSSTGVMVLTTADSAGAGAFQPAGGTLAVNGNASTAVYEILFDLPSSLEFTEIPYTLLNAPMNSTVQVTATFAPFYSTSAASQASSSLPVPRFTNELCNGQTCISVTPDQGTNNGPVSVSLIGNPGLSGAQVKLAATGFADILGTGVSNPAANALNAVFDLTGASPGARDVVITPPSGPVITLPGDFAVTTTPVCDISAAPQNQSFSVNGGTGDLVVTITPVGCPWSATTTASWITLFRVPANQPALQAFDVAPNHATGSRTGSITLGGQVVTVTQDGTSTCRYSISPGSNFFGVDGGASTVNVTAQQGCGWTAASGLSWLTVTAGSSGSGNGSVTLTAAANAGAMRSGTVTIAGQTFTVNQSPTACGAVDVSGSVAVTQDATLAPFDPFSANPYANANTRQLHLVNNGAPVAGPVYVVLDGICPGNGSGLCFPLNTSGSTVCQGTVPFASQPFVLWLLRSRPTRR